LNYNLTFSLVNISLPLNLICAASKLPPVSVSVSYWVG